MKLSKECKETLDNAEKKITILINDEEKDFTPLNQEQNIKERIEMIEFFFKYEYLIVPFFT